MKIQSIKALNDGFDGVLFCVLTKLKYAKIAVFKITSEVLKRLRNICGHFRQRSEVFGKSSEICGSSRNVSGNAGHDKGKIEKKVGRYNIGT